MRTHPAVEFNLFIDSTFSPSRERIKGSLFSGEADTQSIRLAAFLNSGSRLRTQPPSTRSAPLFKLAQTLILVLGLHRDAIVKAFEFTREAPQRLVGLLELGVEPFYHRVGGR